MVDFGEAVLNPGELAEDVKEVQMLLESMVE
jgi:hypothetical protein